MFYGGLAYAHFAAGCHEGAIEWADRALLAQPRMTAVVGVKAVACVCLGRVEEGRECVRRFRELRPGASLAGGRKVWDRVFSPELLVIWIECLRKAGLPEE